MSSGPTLAVILAAGMGTRLEGLFSDRPKGFIEIEGESLIARSIRLLQQRGISRVLIVVGHLAGVYEAWAQERTGVETVLNPAYAETGSMASLACALEYVEEDFLLLESDLFYEERALDALLAGDAPDVLLASAPTGATDEVWIETDERGLCGMSKEAEELNSVFGELVGMVRISHPLARIMSRAYADFVAERGHGRMAYEMDALVEASRSRVVEVRLVPDLLWGEVDYESHYLRVRDKVAPLCAPNPGAGRDLATSDESME
jgi:choline kinase